MKELTHHRDQEGDPDESRLAMLYEAIASKCSKQHPDQNDLVGDLTVRKLRRNFGPSNNNKSGLIYANGKWLPPSSVLLGKEVFGEFRAFVSEVPPTGKLWVTLGGGKQFWNLTRAAPAESQDDGNCVCTTPMWVSKQLLDEMNNELPDDTSDIRRMSSWPVQRVFVYVDVSDFSKLRALEQAIVINSLTTLSNDENAWDDNAWDAGLEKWAFENIESRLCIGDGYIFVFTRAVKATLFAARLAVKIEQLCAEQEMQPQFHFRIGLHVGPVYHFWDTGRNGWNYVGDGINGGARVLQAIGKDYDDLIFLSDAVRQAIRSEPSQREIGSSVPGMIARNLMRAMRPRGRHADKHGSRWRVYELTHDLVARP